MNIKASYLGSVLFFLGLLSIYVGERLVSSGGGRTAFSWLGVALVLAAVALRVIRLMRAQGERRNVEQGFLILHSVGLLGLLLYFLQSDVWTRLADKVLSASSPKLAVVLQVLWPALVAVSLIPVLLGEMAYASMAEAKVVEKGRVLDAVRAGVGLACALVFAFAVAYVAEERDVRWDVSYFRTAKPGDSTRKIARALTEDVNVTYFYPPGNEVGEHVKEYFQDLAKESPMIKVQGMDQALEVAKARELNVQRNGSIVVHKGGRKEQLFIPPTIDSARPQLRNLDKDVQSRLMQVARPRRTLFFTSGHDERGATSASPMDQRATTRVLKDMLSSQNYELQDVSAVEGLALDVPKDAASLFIIGPTKAFLPEEVAAVKRYLDRGGRVFLALDPENKVDFAELLLPFGMKYQPTVLANDRAFVPQTGAPSDRSILFTGSYSSHPAATTLGARPDRPPVVLLGTGYFEEVPNKPGGVQTDMTLRALDSTWNDLNGNYQFDAPLEQRRDFGIMWSITKGSGDQAARLVVLADADALSDQAMQMTLANAVLARDAVLWLVGDEAIAGATSSEVDQPIQHTRKQNVVWFYSTIFLAPALVLALGFFATRGRGGKKKRVMATVATAEVAR